MKAGWLRAAGPLLGLLCVWSLFALTADPAPQEAFRLPEALSVREMRETVTIPLSDSGDNPLWISVYTEDGFQAWSSPVFAFR